MDITGILLTVLTTGGLLAYQLLRGYRYKASHRPAALAAFAAQSIYPDNALVQFDGKTAQLMQEKEVVEQIKGSFLAYTLTRIARNASGEYFWFYFRTDSPLQFKHIEQSKAKVLLKDKYLAPDHPGKISRGER
ncbi:hypothetical protein GBK02_08085 [Dechloromonas sp. TW-R-39-2]|uniref:hypothetical protein n=1 Tax=Dechloromonas sp. TW-R-39-2 TaxID=2654218 RepID=UPI00193D07CF|nr:hypothetical protein [Dechloromonas sp. TW-R-39-2]QRM19358.1 hypothetical protein GBK02_08085 [Dechloromonas sp. TW-R-39-2]